MTIVNSTISGNVTNNFGGGILASYDSEVTLIDSTVSGNVANQDYDINNSGGGGGIYNDGAKVELWNTIFAGNTDLTDPGGHAKWPDVYGAFTSLTGNLIQDGTGSSGCVPDDIVGSAAEPIDPMLGNFDVYAPGHTPLYPLLTGSVAINAVYCPAGVTTDQRGMFHPIGNACDIGACEFEWNTLFLPIIRR